MFKFRILVVTSAIVAVAVALTAGILLSHQNDKFALTSAYADSEQVVEMLNQLDVAVESNRFYIRKKFGGELHDGTCQATRVQVLTSENLGQFKENIDCSVMHGLWRSEYDGIFSKDPSKYAEQPLQLDHLVPLKEAWNSGADVWGLTKRNDYLNDLGYAPSLIMVSAKSNGIKNDSEPGAGKSHYLPPLVAYRCTYVAEWIAVKWRWSLSVDSTEKAKLQKLMSSCTGEIRIPMPKRAK